MVAGAGDINTDGSIDLVWQDQLTGAAQVWFLGGVNGATPMGAASISTGNTWRIRAVADMNGDGRADLVWQDPIAGNSQVWFLGGVQGAIATGSAPLSGAQSWRVIGPR
jgi:hypothetical protein